MAVKRKAVKATKSTFRNKYKGAYTKARKSPVMRTGVTNATG